MNSVSLSQCTGLEVSILCSLEFKEMIRSIEDNCICVLIVGWCCGDALSCI
jgi:hypothetical protein